jgi:CheY-like chemotaxis protein
MGGNISVESNLGQGSCFTFTAEFNSSDATFLPFPYYDLTGANFVVIDRNIASRDLLVNNLTQWGAQVQSVGHGVGALALIQSALTRGDTIDGIFIANNVKSPAAEELAKKLQDHIPVHNIPLIYLGNLSDRYPPAGFMLMVRKPFFPEDLSQLMQELHKFKELEAGNNSQSYHWSPGIKILLVENNPLDQEIGQKLLQNIGLTADVASNGYMALELLKNNTYSLILMDYHIPQMSGNIIAHKIRQGEGGINNRDIPIIAVTADGTTLAKNTCLAAGMSDYLTKPYHRDDLQHVISKWLQGQINKSTNFFPINRF